MMKYQVRSTEDALVYLTDCLLATVSDQAMIKSRKKHAFERHISIAQTACDWIRDLGIDASSTRAGDIIGKCAVWEWAERFMPEKK